MIRSRGRDMCENDGGNAAAGEIVLEPALARGLGRVNRVDWARPLDAVSRERPDFAPNAVDCRYCNRDLRTSCTWLFSSAYLNKFKISSDFAFGSVSRGPMETMNAICVFFEVVTASRLSKSWEQNKKPCFRWSSSRIRSSFDLRKSHTQFSYSTPNTP